MERAFAERPEMKALASADSRHGAGEENGARRESAAGCFECVVDRAGAFAGQRHTRVRFWDRPGRPAVHRRAHPGAGGHRGHRAEEVGPAADRPAQSDRPGSAHCQRRNWSAAKNEVDVANLGIDLAREEVTAGARPVPGRRREQYRSDYRAGRIGPRERQSDCCPVSLQSGARGSGPCHRTDGIFVRQVELPNRDREEAALGVKRQWNLALWIRTKSWEQPKRNRESRRRVRCLPGQETRREGWPSSARSWCWRGLAAICGSIL